MTAMVEFDPTTPVAEGVTVLEASAGTGKTHAVASLVVAEVAEGRPLDELLVVTFTRKATGELRERVWQRLAQAAEALAPGAPPVETGLDPLLAHLGRGTEDERAVRRRNLRVALSDFDAATIATTHGFCQQVLAGLGVAGDAERDVELVEDVRDLVDDAVRDLYVRRVLAGDEIHFEPGTAAAIARAVVEHPDCAIAPVDDHPVDRQRRAFARAVRARIADQKREGRLLTYDDLLDRLDASLAEGRRGDIVAERLRARFSMAVVDEFQDTDTIQWRILERAFGEPPCRLVLVGDPKQAIYAFRGGDVHAYLAATRRADHRSGLSTSWRADRPLLTALDAVLAGAQLGDEAIRHRPVQARPGAEGPGLDGPAAGPPLLVKVARNDSGRFALTKRTRVAAKGAVRAFLAEDLAAEAVRLLNSGSTLDGRPVGPGDLAVLTRTHHEATVSRDALHGVGVPAVVHGAGSVWRTDAARHWGELLDALEQPARPARVRAVAIGPFVGWDAARLAAAREADWEALDALLHDWAATARAHTVAGVLRRVEAGTRLSERLLGTVGGDRLLSDLRHLAELLHARQADHPSSLTALSGWVAEQRAAAAEPGAESGAESARRRLETDADAVAVHTIHSAKGLEFPIVLLPSLWDARRQDDDDVCTFHDTDGHRALSVGGGGDLRRWQLDRAEDERDQEELRLLYVALTRARHRVVAWWASASDSDRSPLARVLLAADPATGAVARCLDHVPTEDEITVELTARLLPTVEATGATGERYDPPALDAAALSVARFDRGFDRCWVRTSYSGLTREAHETGPRLDVDLGRDPGGEGTSVAAADAEREEAATVDEPRLESGAAADAEALPLPLADVPGGARVGTLVHEVLEQIDFAAADLDAELVAATEAAGAPRLVEGHEPALVAGVAQALRTPWGEAWDDVRLCDLTRHDRLDELAFDLPLAGGDRPHDRLVTMAAVADVFAGLPAGDPLAGYHERLRDPLLTAEVRGFLSGSIDLVARLADGPGGDARHVVVDYKTNHLVPHGEVGLTAHYRPEALAAAMADAHYPLQAALYAVALHRFLRWRLPAYDPGRHLGGVAYLFLRGMVGPDTPRVGGAPAGVFTWQPPVAFVTDLSDLLDRGAP
ncbi:MAG: UvrD-helicase domain-containing protein [Acidimicrobiales bacterium]|nr:UvrD-helicase domain-containing protein [Acidimicrobiales bacterium]